MLILEYIKTIKGPGWGNDLLDILKSGEYDKNERDEEGYNLLEHMIKNVLGYEILREGKRVTVITGQQMHYVIKRLIKNGHNVDGERISPILTLIHQEMYHKNDYEKYYMYGTLSLLINYGCDVNLPGKFENGDFLLDYILKMRKADNIAAYWKYFKISVVTIKKLINAGAKINNKIYINSLCPTIRKLLIKTQNPDLLI